MEQLIVKISSNNTSSEIKKFVSQFEDASIENDNLVTDEYYMESYGIDKQTFESQINIGIAESVLGLTKPWNEVKQQLLSKIENSRNFSFEASR